MKKDIYIIENKINNKVYIGQSVNAAERWLKHLSDVKHRPNNQLIHKAMKKYGVQNFYYKILEYQIEDYDIKEKYWIEQYNSLNPFGYNLSEGGGGSGSGINSPLAAFQSGDELSKVIDDIINSNLNFSTIAKKYDCAESTISAINTGRYYYDSNLSYPLRQTRYSKELVKQIKYSLKFEQNKTLTDIAKEYHIDFSQVNEINQGKIHTYNNENYPLRTGKVTPVKNYVKDIICLLKESSLSQKEIAQKFNISVNAVSCINKGKSFHQDGETYPIRINYQCNDGGRKCLSPEEVVAIENELSNSTKSMRHIAQDFEIALNTVLNINVGSIIKYRNKNTSYPLRSK